MKEYPVADLVAQVTVLERLDDRRDQLIGQLRRTASAGMRPARTSPPVREILLETLADFRWPQNAGFLEEYLLAKHQLQLDSRAFAPLRRDERNAWDRAPGAREAYIAPALKPDGSANPRWITRSDWDMERRIVATPRTERLFDLYKIYVLAGRPGSAEASYLGPRTPRRCAAREVRAGHPRHRATVGIRIRRGVQGMARAGPRARRQPHRGDPPGGRARPQADRPPAC